ncbi:MAG: CPBP family intramembrane metalloprotease [Anaerolineales bacterium]|nr:CPBP family intramembrane metalloprotease [Anaerolineales bacterium]
MAGIKDIFWHPKEHRPRAFWRLFGQILVLIPILLFFGIAFGFCTYWFLISQGSVNPEAMSDPGLVQSQIMNNPFLLILTYAWLAPSVVISIWLSGRFLDRRPFADFGFHFDKDWWWDFAFGLFLGGFLMGIAFLVEWLAGWVVVTGTFVTQFPDLGFGLALILPLFLFLMVGFYEELFSRGYQLKNLAEGLRGELLGSRGAVIIAVLFSSGIFGVLHSTNPNATLFSTLNICLAGVLLSTGYILTGELAIPIGLHITWNFFQGNVFGFPVSGANFRSATFIAIHQRGPDLWTGGAFGPEGGLLGVGMMIAGMVLTVFWVRFRRGKADFYLPLAEPPAHNMEEEEPTHG